MKEISATDRSRMLRAVRRVDTKPEVAIRSALHRSGLRFRKDHPLRVAGTLVRPDIVFTRRKVAVFIDGCFWHVCPEHCRRPNRNTEFWNRKLLGNKERDERQNAALRSDGWVVLRIWEHEPVDRALALIVEVIDANAVPPV